MDEKLENNKCLFDFDLNLAKKYLGHCEEEQSSDEAIQKKGFGLLHSVRNDIIIIGTDEAGRGPGAGGVFASAVCFNNIDNELIEKLCTLNDSKKLSPKKREELYEIILENTINSTVCVEVEEIEKINILNASLKAMGLAVGNVIKEIGNGKWEIESFKFPVHHSPFIILVDGNKKIKTLSSPLFSLSLNINQQTIIKGDSQSASIAAASILAKVSRDRYMEELDKKFPQYNWQQNKGYLTQEHLNALDKYGLTSYHRKKFLRKYQEKIIQQTLDLNLLNNESKNLF